MTNLFIFVHPSISVGTMSFFWSGLWWESMVLFLATGHLQGCRRGKLMCQVIQAVTFWSPIVGGHKQPFKRVTFSPSQKGHVALNHQVGDFGKCLAGYSGRNVPEVGEGTKPFYANESLRGDDSWSTDTCFCSEHLLFLGKIPDETKMSGFKVYTPPRYIYIWSYNL